MATIILALTDLSCGHCIKNVKGSLEAIEGVQSAEVGLNFAKIVSDKEPRQFIEAIEKAGYGARLAEPTFRLALSGLSCGHCVKNTEKALSAVENVEVFNISKNEAEIYGEKAQAEAVIAAIQNAGYQAVLLKGENSRPKPEAPAQETPAQATRAAQSEALSDEITTTASDEIIISSAAQTTLLLEGLSCAACVRKVEKALSAVAGVDNVQVNLAESSALIFGDAAPQALVAAVREAGYGAEVVEDENLRREKQRLQSQAEIRGRKWQAIIALIVGFGLMSWDMLMGMSMVSASNRFSWLMVGLAVLAVMLFCGGHFYRGAWKSLVKGTATMDTLVALGTGVAWLFSMFIVVFPDFFPPQSRHLYFESSAMIIGLINLGKMLEAKAKQRSSKALERLLDLTPKSARVVDAEGEREIPLAAVVEGMILRLQTGDRVSVDGEVQQGSAWIDESMLSGEPLPVFKQRGDKVSAGTLVSDGTVLFRAQQIGRNTRLANIIKLVRRAQSSKPKIGRLADSIAAVFVPVVIMIALIAAALWYVFGPQPQLSYALTVLTTVLIIACPCALGLATPMSVIAGVGRAAELGILVRDADALQKAADADTVIFDKTGTLTKGQPKVSAVYCFNGFSEEEIIRSAACLEQGSAHPLAKALLALAQEKGYRITDEVADFRTLKGLGVSGRIQGKTLLLGSRTLLQGRNIDTEIAALEFARESEGGATLVFLAVEGMLAGVLAIRDLLREDTAMALARLHKQGYHLIMLTGDQERSAQAIAREAGIDQVIAGVLPEGKAEVVRQLQQQGRKVVMVGDGINDAPALAQADVSIAMGGGSDIAIETAELTLMRHSLNGVADALSLAKGTLGNMKQNLFAAFIYNSLGIPIAAGVLYPWLGLLLNPMIGGAAMALSSISVATNANRLLKFRPRQ
ncbi:Cu+-exporting ATPase [Mesocricetibacter intestinalis]|uniref:Copper-exporting P-type ATPase n=1 Tax=Mesocricetibacter intestinalis TaxID=1521930 RepID=A0A4R6V707_9PAST|nr:cation transporter [Mesocricetibacter intestinalis]TDQ57133.1 Cu+-exporting ATPase [Mesocricetibacter intestinalis]